MTHKNDGVDTARALATQRSRMNRRPQADARDGCSLASQRSRQDHSPNAPSTIQGSQLGCSAPWSKTPALGFAAYGAQHGLPRVFYRGFAADPVAAMAAARHAEATVLHAFGLDDPAECQFNLEFDEVAPSLPPLVTLTSDDGEWPYELALVGPPLPVLGKTGSGQVSRRSAQAPARVERRIRKVLCEDEALHRLTATGTPITYRQSVGWWPGVELPRLHARFGLWTPDDEPVVVADATALAVLETLLRSAAFGTVSASVSHVMPRLWRPHA